MSSLFPAARRAPVLPPEGYRAMTELPEDEDGPIEVACVNAAGIQPVLAVRHSVYRDRWVAQANACELPWKVLGWRKPEAVPPPL